MEDCSSHFNKQTDPKALNWLRWPTWPHFSLELVFNTRSRGDPTRQHSSIRLCSLFWFARRPLMPRPPDCFFFFLSLYSELIWQQQTNNRLWKSTMFSLVHTFPFGVSQAPNTCVCVCVCACTHSKLTHTRVVNILSCHILAGGTPAGSIRERKREGKKERKKIYKGK